MSPVNGHSYTNGTPTAASGEKSSWQIGLINSTSKYLTAETFGFKINANGTTLKKKQIWTLEPYSDNPDGGFVSLRSHLDRYMAVDQFGNVTCDSTEKDPTTQFEISVTDDGTGRWALRNVLRGYFVGAKGDKLICDAKIPGDSELWFVHLWARPQVNLRSVGRKRFARLSEDGDEIRMDSNVPWGADTLFTLEFRDNKYALHTCNDKYLNKDGSLQPDCGKECLFAAEFHGGYLALRDAKGLYVSPFGSSAQLKARSKIVTKDELFSLEDSLPQAAFLANLNARYVSVKQGIDLTANQDEISADETFQLEFDGSSKKWAMRTMGDKYWTLDSGGGIQAGASKRSPNSLFELTWLEDGSTVAIRAGNGKYVGTKKSGHLYANIDSPSVESGRFFFEIVNRPMLVLRCDQGYVGKKNGTHVLECNKSKYDFIRVEKGSHGAVYFKGSNGKYWRITAAGVTADSESPQGFYIQLVEPSKLCIRTSDGCYLNAEKNGAFRPGDADFSSATKWEY